MIELFNRVIGATPKKTDPDLIDTFTPWLHRLFCRFGRDDNRHHLDNPHPPTPEIVARFVAIADPNRLAGWLDNLLFDHQQHDDLEIHSYGWFVSVALHNIHGIKSQVTKKAYAALREVKHGRAPQPTQENLLDTDRTDTAEMVRTAVAGVKNLR